MNQKIPTNNRIQLKNMNFYHHSECILNTHLITFYSCLLLLLRFCLSHGPCQSPRRDHPEDRAEVVLHIWARQKNEVMQRAIFCIQVSCAALLLMWMMLRWLLAKSTAQNLFYDMNESKIVKILIKCA